MVPFEMPFVLAQCRSCIVAYASCLCLRAVTTIKVNLRVLQEDVLFWSKDFTTDSNENLLSSAPLELANKAVRHCDAIFALLAYMLKNTLKMIR